MRFITILLLCCSNWVLAAQYIKCEEVFSFGKIDLNKGFNYYQDKAQQGDACAQYELGYLYESGILTPHDYLLARKWYRKSADQGVLIAQIMLANFYANGVGVKQSYANALLWLEVAAKQIDQARQAQENQEIPSYLVQEQHFVTEQIDFYRTQQDQQIP